MKINPIVFKYARLILLTIFFITCYFSQNEKSVTVDEFSHFPSGIYNLLTLDWRMDHESPPLIKCLPAITSIITQPKIDIKLFEAEPNPWSLGYHFMYNNQSNYQDIFRYGRCVVILIGCWLGWLIYRFGTQLYGQVGGLLALFLYVFNPNIIAHSSLTTIDIGASCFISNNHEKPLFLKDIGYILTIILVSLLLINAGYFFKGSFTPIGDYHFLSAPLNKISSLIEGIIPVPLPYDYISGFDSQL